ncbi:MAG: response regulator [Actinomycetota bacterium]|nr:response regulator [Actinomycetota bacterium]
MEPKRRVLIVDDSLEIRDLLTRLLEKDDFEIVGGAATTQEALDIATRHQPDFVLLDFLMPQMNGGQLAPLLREAAPAARIIAFSGFLADKPNWADDFLDKRKMAQVGSLLKSFASPGAQQT